jgi:hypothetical protein
MGAVYMPSMKDLQKVLKCNDRELKKLGRRMSETVIVGSMEIWRQTTRNIGAGTNEEMNRLIEEEAILAEEAGAAMEVEGAAGSGSGPRAGSEGEARGETEMDTRMDDIELEEEGFEANFEAGREWEERKEVLRVGSGMNAEIEVEDGAEAMVNSGAKADGASMIADQGLEAEAGGEAEGEGEAGAGARGEAGAETVAEARVEVAIGTGAEPEIEAIVIAGQAVEAEAEAKDEAEDEGTGEVGVGE